MSEENKPDFVQALLVLGASGFIAWIGWEMLSAIESITVPVEGVGLAIAAFIGIAAYYMFY